MSIRLRLTLWYVVVLCAGLAVFAGAVLWQTQQAARAAFDDDLRHRAQDVRADLVMATTSISVRLDGPDESSRRPGEAAVWIRIVTPQGRILLQQGPSLAGLPAAALAGLPAGFHEQDVAGNRHARIFVLPVIYRGQRRGMIQMITTTDQMDAQRRQLLAAMGVAGVLILIIASLGGLFLANRALRPVDRITRLAGQIGAGDLHRRISDVVWGTAPRQGWRDDELGRLARTFDAMLQRLEEAGERRRRLTADVAHELGTPIATISSGAEIALRHPRSPDEYRAALQHIWDESRHMGRVVDDLVLLARADAGQLPLQHELVEMDEVCRQAVRALEPLAEQRAVALRAVLPPHPLLVRGDDVRLSQVVRNLLDNALRYTPPGGAVTLTLQHEQGQGRDAPTVTLRVGDTGPGIDPGERDYIFERFHRASGDSHARSGGSGLGLAICKAIVHAHGGRIGVTDAAASVPAVGQSSVPAERQSRGAEFVVVLPAAADSDNL